MVEAEALKAHNSAGALWWARCMLRTSALLLAVAVAGGPSPSRADPEEWDSRLDDLGIHLQESDAPDGSVDISDAVAVLLHLFVEAVEAHCEDALDSNDDGTVDISDPVATLNFLFLGGTPLSPGCGPDSTADDIGCFSHAGCLPP